MSDPIVTICNGKYKCECLPALPIVRVDGIPKVVTNLNVTLEVCLYPNGDINEVRILT